MVVVNPVAGGGRVGRDAAPIQAALHRHGLDFELEFSLGPGHATALARAAADAGFDVVVAAGGDGTMGEVLNGIAGTRAALGLLPLGTGNDLARTFGIPRVLEQAAAVLAGGRVRRVDLGRERDACFAIIAGLGFPAEVMYHVNTTRSPLRGSLRIVGSILALLPGLRPFSMRVRLDQEILEGSYLGVFILNTRYTGGGLLMSPHARTDDGLLDVVLVGPMTRLGFLAHLPGAYHGRHLAHPQVWLYRSSRVVVESDEPLRKMFDGNVTGALAPVEAWVEPGALPLIVPAAASAP